MIKQKGMTRLVGWLEGLRAAFRSRDLDKGSSKRITELGIIIVVGIAFSLIYYFPIINTDNNLGIQDWDQNFAWTEANRITIVTYHQFPLWNPYKCGGTAQFANPQVPVLSIQMLLALLFGTLKGIKLSIFVHGVFGFIGFYYLARQYGLSYLGSTLASVIYSFSGITGSFLSSGMVVFTNIAYTPFTIICFNKAIQRKRWGIIAGILFALSFYFSYQIPLLLGVYIFIYTVVFGIVNRSVAILKAFIIMSLSAAVIILPKLLLSIQLLEIYPRQLDDVSGYSIYNFFYFLLSRQQNLMGEMNAQGYFYKIDENSLYIGILALVFFLLFFVRNKAVIKSNLVLIIILPIIFWIMLGSEIFPSLYDAVHHLPIFSSFRVAQRFRFDLMIPLALIIGFGSDNLVRLLGIHKLDWLVGVICLMAVSVDLITFSTDNFLSKTLIIINPEKQLASQATFVQTLENPPDIPVERTIILPMSVLENRTFDPWSYEYLKIIQNEGVLNCYDPIPIIANASSVGDPQYQGEYHLLNVNSVVKLENTYWSPNKLVYSISNSMEANGNFLIINQNFYPGWVVTKDKGECKRAIPKFGLLSTRIDTAFDRVTFSFDPFKYHTLCRKH